MLPRTILEQGLNAMKRYRTLPLHHTLLIHPLFLSNSLYHLHSIALYPVHSTLKTIRISTIPYRLIVQSPRFLYHQTYLLRVMFLSRFETITELRKLLIIMTYQGNQRFSLRTEPYSLTVKPNETMKLPLFSLESADNKEYPFSLMIEPKEESFLTFSVPLPAPQDVSKDPRLVNFFMFNGNLVGNNGIVFTPQKLSPLEKARYDRPMIVTDI